MKMKRPLWWDHFAVVNYVNKSPSNFYESLGQLKLRPVFPKYMSVFVVIHLTNSFGIREYTITKFVFKASVLHNIQRL